ncbi:hypothetical protein MUK42_35056 [Musa troglodytarum]|uniref:Uncharacterized protein n=1 Tax=Musa troglodytarum TaxID=320322 RepID=A0A9E7E8A6_9LILI|nr:hypothetical protein MUK42_35056 [Musa troglodytarum]
MRPFVGKRLRSAQDDEEIAKRAKQSHEEESGRDERDVSKEYPLFISRQNFCSSIVESSSDYDLSSMESERKPYLDTSRSGSFSYSCASPHSLETHMDLQQGISLLKKSVACITTCCYNSLCLDVPSEASTFEAFAKLLDALSSSCFIFFKGTTVNKKFIEDGLLKPNAGDHHFSNSDASFGYSAEVTASVNSESLVEGWDIVEHPQSQVEDV